ncbi:MAG: nitroreductase [Planctomycetes bacterium]|nr:nitroreductase [Planctomycetota bacterium]
MEFDGVIKTRRSVRSYRDDPIPDDVLERVLTAAQSAPSANNVQPWRYIVVRDEATRKKIAEVALNQAFIAEAPVVIVCCGRNYHDSYSWIADNMFLVDCTISFDHLTLAARNEGLGTCWIGAFDHPQIKEVLDVPVGYDVVVLTPLGYPKSDQAFRPVSNRKPLSEIAFSEKFGRQ